MGVTTGGPTVPTTTTTTTYKVINRGRSGKGGRGRKEIESTSMLVQTYCLFAFPEEILTVVKKKAEQQR